MEESNKIELKTIEHYNYIIKKYKKDTKELYDKAFRFNDVIGKCTKSYRIWAETTDDKSLKSFFDYYITNVKTEGEFRTAAAILSHLTKLPREDMLDLLICHGIVETYLGGRFETYVIDYIKKQKGAELIYLDKKTRDEFDRTYGIDIMFTYNGKIFLVQVKPVSFFLGNYETIVADRIDALVKIENFKKDYPQYKDAVLKFCVYDKTDESFLTIKNSIFLDLDEKYFGENVSMFKNDFRTDKSFFKKIL